MTTSKLAGLVLILLLTACEGTITASDIPEGLDAEPGAVLGGPTETASQPDAVGDVTIEPGSGEALFNANCAGCHGVEAVGTSTFEGSIAGYSPIHETVKMGQGAMPAIALSDSEIELVQEYLLTLGTPDWSDLSGPEIFAAECARCHGAEAQGTENAPQLRFRDAIYFEHVARNGGRANRFASEMPQYAEDRISDAQMAELIAWVDAFPNAQSGEGLYNQFCANCHGGESIPARVFEDLDDEPAREIAREGEGDGVTDREYMPRWAHTEISDAELGLIQGYIDGL